VRRISGALPSVYASEILIESSKKVPRRVAGYAAAGIARGVSALERHSIKEVATEPGGVGAAWCRASAARARRTGSCIGSGRVNVPDVTFPGTCARGAGELFFLAVR
jgi:hypothetical protein